MESFEALKPVKSAPKPEKPSPLSPEAKAETLGDIALLEKAIEEAEKAKEKLKKSIQGKDEDSQKELVVKLKEALAKGRRLKRKVEGIKESLVISTEFKYRDEKGKEKREKIEIDIDEQVEKFSGLYEKYGVEIPADFSGTIKDIWNRNSSEIEEAIKEKGFNTVILVPENLPKSLVLNNLLTEGYAGTYESDNFKEGGSFEGVTDKIAGCRIILVHDSVHIKDHPVLKGTLGGKANKFMEDREKLTLSDYLILQRKIFDETGNHIDTKHEDGYYYWTWLPGSTVSKEAGGGFRVVNAHWSPDDGQIGVNANDPDNSYPNLGCRLSRLFS